MFDNSNMDLYMVMRGKYFWGQKNVGGQKVLGQQFLGIKFFWSSRILGGQHFRVKKIDKKIRKQVFLPPFKNVTQNQPLLAVT